MSQTVEDMEEIEGYPSLEILMQKTEKITKKIQELLLSAQERNIARYGEKTSVTLMPSHIKRQWH